MTQEEKELLLKDLCARLPYGVICDRLGKPKKLLSISPYKVFCCEFDNGEYMPSEYGLDNFKPYLRPMESMTEEEAKEWHATFESVYDLVPGGDPDNEDDYDDNCHEEPGIESYDYLNAHHFDYRGLIPMGLALPAPEGMYNE